jgi:hypothetical protein
MANQWILELETRAIWCVRVVEKKEWLHFEVRTRRLPRLFLVLVFEFFLKKITMMMLHIHPPIKMLHLDITCTPCIIQN